MEKREKKRDSFVVTFRWKNDFYEMVKEDARRNGVSIGAYLAMLASQKHLETETMRFMSLIPENKLKDLIEEELGKGGPAD